jgi:hypothetical protein
LPPKRVSQSDFIRYLISLRKSAALRGAFLALFGTIKERNNANDRAE